MTPAACLEIAHERLRETRLLLDNQLYDGACSRAYFAAHIAVRGALLALEVPPPRTHDGLKHLFNLHLGISGARTTNEASSHGRVWR